MKYDRLFSSSVGFWWHDPFLNQSTWRIFDPNRNVYDGAKLLTNFPKDELPMYEAAIKEYKESGGKHELFIRDSPTGYNGKALMTDLEIKSLSDFWRIFERIKKQSI